MEVGPQQLLFLLQDLYGKMKVTLIPSVSSFFASKVCTKVYSKFRYTVHTCKYVYNCYCKYCHALPGNRSQVAKWEYCVIPLHQQCLCGLFCHFRVFKGFVVCKLICQVSTLRHLLL